MPSGSAPRPPPPDMRPAYARVLVNRKGAVPMATAPLASALSPTQLRSAYNLNGTSGGGRTVAIVDAYGYPNLAARPGDLPRPVRPAGLHHRQRLPEDRRPDRRHEPAAHQRRLGQEQALDVDAVSADLPRLQDPRRPGQERRRSPTSARPSTPPRRHGRRGRDLQQLRRRRRGPTRRTAPTTTTRASRSPPRPVTTATRAAPTRPPRPTSPPSAARR